MELLRMHSHQFMNNLKLDCFLSLLLPKHDGHKMPPKIPMMMKNFPHQFYNYHSMVTMTLVFRACLGVKVL